MADPNQTPEQIARDQIDARLRAAGWDVQGAAAIAHGAAPGIAVREYQTSIGPADYALFADKRALCVVEAKPDAWGERLTTVETQSSSYATAQLKWVKNPEPLPFIYEATGAISRKEPLPVVYNPKVPPEFFDVVIIDKCRRSIYNLWRQVIEYFDSFRVGLTATPDARTYGFFQKNVVSEYTHVWSVIQLRIYLHEYVMNGLFPGLGRLAGASGLCAAMMTRSQSTPTTRSVLENTPLPQEV